LTSTNHRAGARLVRIEPVVDERGGHQIGDAGGGRAGAEEHDRRSRNGMPVTRSRSRRRPGDGRRALDVVVEAEHAVPVLVQQRVGVGRQEILELDERVG
jgi:hypothetical protein